MSKPPKEQARDYVWHNYGEGDFNEHNWDRSAEEIWLAGYQAAKDEYKVAIDIYNDVAKQMMEEAVRRISPEDQLADASKVMCSTTMEEIKAVDTGELMPITNLPTSAQWISVKERLPEEGENVLVFDEGVFSVNGLSSYTHKWHPYENGFDCEPSCWMPLPEAPKEER